MIHWNKQVGGNHYSKMKIQPAEFINENNLLFAEGNAIKYICRHKSKGKEKDIEKAIHYLRNDIREGLFMNKSEAQIQQLEKRAKGFRRLIAALNDLNMYGIHQQIDKILFVKVDELKDHLKLKIKRNNDKLNEFYTESIDSLVMMMDQHWR